jgi:hypothetical protein
MESTLKDIKSKTYGIVTDPTYMSYGLIGFTTLILGYYVFYDKNSSGISSEEASPKSEDASAVSSPSALGGLLGSSAPASDDASTPAVGGMFGTSETKEEEAPSAPGGLFGSENAEPAASDEANASAEKTIGGKRKKTRRRRKQNKSKTNKSRK